MKTALLFAGLLAIGAAGCNRYAVDEARPAAPQQGSVVSTTGGLLVFWSAVDGADDYRVFASEDPDATGEEMTCDGQEGALVLTPPCAVRDRQEGVLQYVRIATVEEGFDPQDPALSRLVSLAVRPAFPGQPRGPVVWAGDVRTNEDGSNDVYLNGAWFDDEGVPGASHVCVVLWTPAADQAPIDPCTNADLSLAGELSGALSTSELGATGRYHPVLEVEADDGRTGQAFTTVVIR